MKVTLLAIVKLFIVSIFTMSILFLQNKNVFYRYDRILMDALYQSAGVGRDDLKIIAIDDKTLEELGPFGSWSRGVYADLLEKMYVEDMSPTFVAFDINFTGNLDSEGDLAFAKACEGKDILVASSIVYNRSVVNTGEMTYIDNLHVSDVSLPYASLRDVTVNGFTDTLLDEDGRIRAALLKVNHDGTEYYSFAYEMANLYCRKQGIEVKKPKVDGIQRFWFNYIAKTGDYETISLIDVLEGKINPKVFHDSIVMVGAYTSGLQDAYHVPIENSKQMFGVEIQANLFEALLTDNTYQQVTVNQTDLYILIVLAVVAIMINYVQALRGSVVVICASAIHLLIGKLLFLYGYELSLFTALIGIICFYFIDVGYEFFLESLDKKRIVDTFKKYVAPQVVEDVIKKGNVSIALGGETKDIAVMFVDIRGFTSISEQLDAQQVVEFLNIYLNMTTSAIFHHLGTVDKFVGDATMAVFNSPFDLDDYVFRAVATAIKIAKNNEEMEKVTQEKYGFKVGFGIGVHCGKAVIGNVGSETRMDFTAIGDTVNTASRLESKAKSGQILISKEVKERLEGRIVVEKVGDISLKGKAVPVEVFEVLGLKEDSYEK